MSNSNDVRQAWDVELQDLLLDLGAAWAQLDTALGEIAGALTGEPREATEAALVLLRELRKACEAREAEVDSSVLAKAIGRRWGDYTAALDWLRERTDTDPEAHARLWSLREAQYLTSCLRRLLEAGHFTTEQLHRAFGAPGDFGYETPIGAALSETYTAAAKGGRHG